MTYFDIYFLALNIDYKIKEASFKKTKRSEPFIVIVGKFFTNAQRFINPYIIFVLVLLFVKLEMVMYRQVFRWLY